MTKKLKSVSVLLVISALLYYYYNSLPYKMTATNQFIYAAFPDTPSMKIIPALSNTGFSDGTTTYTLQQADISYSVSVIDIPWRSRKNLTETALLDRYFHSLMDIDLIDKGQSRMAMLGPYNGRVITMLSKDYGLFGRYFLTSNGIISIIVKIKGKRNTVAGQTFIRSLEIEEKKLIMSVNESGTLYIVATPIGNLDDITIRAQKILSQVDLVLAEDTRHSNKLLSHFGIKSSLSSLHNFNEGKKSEWLIQRILQGESMALISDAGTPLISDPGFPLVREARTAGISVVPIPGCCALITALCASGLPVDRFCFEGFLPAKTQARVSRLTDLQKEQRTLCFYESPHRLLDSLSDTLQVLGNRHVVVAKELTKAYERFFSNNLNTVISELSEHKELLKGEFIILIEGSTETEPENDEITKLMTILLSESLPNKQAANIATQILHCKKKDAYQAGLNILEAQAN